MRSYWTGVLRVLRKELREARRDRSLVISVVLIPLFFPPLLGVGAVQILQIIQGMAERETRTVLLSEGVPQEFRAKLGELERVLFEDSPAELSAPKGTVASFRAFRAERTKRKTPVPDCLLAWSGIEGEGPESAFVWYDGSRERSSEVRGEIVHAVQEWKEDRLRQRMESAGFSKRDFELFSIEEEDIATAEESGRYVASMILPLFLIAMLGTGAFYAALDTVVGERERRTLETMLVSPLLRGQILLGKYVFVVLSGCVALVLNLLSLSLFLQLLMSVLETEEPIRIVFSPGSVAVIIGAAILTAGLFAAIMMVLVIPSKTYREGQATLTPLTLLVLFPSVIAAVSREPFDLRQASIPLVNAASLFESALLGDLPVRPTAVTFLVLLAMTGLALALAARIVSREDIFLEPRVTLRELFVWKGAAR